MWTSHGLLRVGLGETCACAYPNGFLLTVPHLIVWLVHVRDELLQHRLQFADLLGSMVSLDLDLVAAHPLVLLLQDTFALIADEDSDFAPIVGIGNPVDESFRHHLVDDFGQRRMMQRKHPRQFTHGETAMLRGHFENSLLLQRYAFQRQLPRNVAVGLDQQMGQIVINELL